MPSCSHVDFCQFYWAVSQGGKLGDRGPARDKENSPSVPGEEHYYANMKQQVLSLGNYEGITSKAATKYTLLPMKQKGEKCPAEIFKIRKPV